MKKQILIGIAICTVGAAIAQTSSKPAQSVAPLKINPVAAKTTRLHTKALGSASTDSFENCVYALNNKPHNQTQNRAFTTATLGNTGYQMQTNASVCNRIVKSPDGTISATWTMSQQQAAWSDRGTGYNYFDGSVWGAAPTVRIEGLRTGFPNVGITTGGKEVVVTHDGTQLNMTSRAAKGTGAWADVSLTGSPDTWGRMCVGGANGQTIHVIGRGGSSANANDAVTYSRSLDGGATWDIQDFIIPAIDASNYLGFGGDQYAITAKGDTIAIVLCGFDVDVILLKSVDNGTTWAKTIVHKFPIPLYDGTTMNTVDSLGVTDTIESNDASIAVLLDNQGKAHVWYGRMRVTEAVGGTGLSYFPYTDGLMYWNESFGTTEPVMIETVKDLNNNGILDMYNDPTGAVLGMGTYQVCLTSMPNAGIDAAGNIYLAFSSIFEGTNDDGSGVGGVSPTGKSYRHEFLTASPDGGATWCVAKDLTNPDSPVEGGAYDYLEGVFGAVAKSVDGFVHLIVEQDNSTGHGVSTTTTPDPQTASADIIYYKVPVGDVLCPLGIANNEASASDVKLYPNPATQNATLSFYNTAKGNVSVRIYNVTGQMVSELTNQTYSAGTHELNVDLSKYNSGIYFYTVSFENNSLTGKLIVQ